MDIVKVVGSFEIVCGEFVCVGVWTALFNRAGALNNQRRRECKLAAPKEQTWSCEAVNGGEFAGGDTPDCSNRGGKQYNLQKPGAVGDTCQPCRYKPRCVQHFALTEDSPCPAGIIPISGSDVTCNDACSR